MTRPVLYVLAGVNGAGKSSLGGRLLARAGLGWFDPDAFARELFRPGQLSQIQANAMAWKEGVRRLDEAIACRRSFAMETTLGGRTIARRLAQAVETHDVLIWYCGLVSIEKHLMRIRARVASGGHDIPADKVRERWRHSVENLIALMPQLAHLRVYDNSADALDGYLRAEPLLVLDLAQGVVRYPKTLREVRGTPDWAKPIVEAALEDSGR